jgi:hypothetical protein
MLVGMDTIPITIGRLKLGLESAFHNLTMFPLLGGEAGGVEPMAPGAGTGPSYLTLDEALSQGWAEITEISEQGSVPELKVLNRASSPVLIVDGEELIGAKQNRIANLTILVPAQAQLTIPVSCVEAGRWRARSRGFTAAPRTHYATGRARKMRQVTQAMVERGERLADQSDVWSHIAEKSARLDARSDTGAAEAMYQRHEHTIEDYVRACPPVDGQAGALFVIGGGLAGLDLFDSPVTLRKLLPKLVRSYALDAIDAGAGVPKDGPARTRRPAAGLRQAAELFLRLVAEADAKSMRAVGLGTDVRLVAAAIAGAALVHDGRVVHLSAFAV